MDEAVEAQLRSAAQQVLGRLGPLTVPQLATELAAQTDLDAEVVPDHAELRHLLLTEPEEGFAAFPLADGRLCDLDRVLEGLTLTRQLAVSERGANELVMGDDLAALYLGVDAAPGLVLADGSVLALERRSLVGPAGWVPDAPALAVQLSVAGCTVSPLTDVPEVDATVAERLAEVHAVLRGMDQVVGVSELVLEARARFPLLLATPQAPLSALLDAAGLRVVDDQVLAEDEADPEPYDEDDELEVHLREDHHLDEAEIVDVLLVLTAVRNLVLRVQHAVLTRLAQEPETASQEPRNLTELLPEILADARGGGTSGDPAAGPFAGVPAATARLLRDEQLAVTLVEDVAGTERLHAVMLTEVLDGIERTLRDRHSQANAAWVRAMLLELTAEDHAQAEPLLRRALELDPDHVAATLALAHYLDDRGRAGPALSLLKGLQAPTLDRDRALLRRYAQPGPVAAERNAPCPCGSGRKYKVCCQTSNGWPLQERLDWVWHKVARFTAGPLGQEVLVEVAVDAQAGRDGDPGADDPLVVNLALFEGELLRDLCDLRGSLLPADELALLRAWSEVRAAAYEVVEVVPGSGLTLLDLTSGERTEVHDRSLSRQLTVGEAVLAWLVPTPEGAVPSVGTVRIVDQQRTPVLALLDAGGGLDAIADWYAGLHAPPELRTTDGDPVELIRRTYRVSEPDAVWAALAAELEEDGDGLVAVTERDGQRWLQGRIDRDEDRLVVQVNSAARALRFDELLHRVAADPTLIDEERRSVTDVRLAGAGSADAEADGLDLESLDPEDRAVLEEQLEQLVRTHEDAWVDTPLPALSGATPREAAADPTRRDTLLRLLDEVEAHSRDWRSHGRSMDAARLRSLLDL